jgi:hypothetical protein
MVMAAAVAMAALDTPLRTSLRSPLSTRLGLLE